MARSRLLLIITTIVCLIAGAAYARSTVLNLNVKSTVDASAAKDKLLDVKYYMAGQKHPAIANSIGIYTSKKATNAFNKSDEAACGVAFISAMISLQQRALKSGGDAVVDIMSITDQPEFKSASEFRCAAGNVVAKVSLSGRVVKLK